MSSIENDNVLDIAREHYDYWSEAGNSLWCEILERCIDRNDLEELNVQLIKSMLEMKQLEMTETFGERVTYED